MRACWPRLSHNTRPFVYTQGEVSFSRFSETRNCPEDVGSRSTGAHFGTHAAAADSRSARAGGGGDPDSGRRTFTAKCSQVHGGALLMFDYVSPLLSCPPPLPASHAGPEQPRLPCARSLLGRRPSLCPSFALQPCEFAILTKVGYNRIVRTQLQRAMAARIAVLEVRSFAEEARLSWDGWWSQGRASEGRPSTYLDLWTFRSGRSLPLLHHRSPPSPSHAPPIPPGRVLRLFHNSDCLEL